MSAFFLGSFFAGFIIAIVRNWRLALVISTIIPCIGLAGSFMNKFVTDAKTKQLAATGRGATLAEEVISSVRISHAFGTQRKLASLYNEPNEETNQVGQASAKYQGFGLGVFFFIIYSSYALAFYYGTTLILRELLTPILTIDSRGQFTDMVTRIQRVTPMLDLSSTSSSQS